MSTNANDHQVKIITDLHIQKKKKNPIMQANKLIIYSSKYVETHEIVTLRHICKSIRR